MRTLDCPSGSPKTSHAYSGSVAWLVLPMVLLLGLIGITGYFRLGSETTALRESVMDSTSGQWHKKIAFHLGWVTTSLVRFGAEWVKLDAEPRAALQSVRAVEVGVYRLEQSDAPPRLGTALARADKALARRGWLRMVGVCQDQELVAVYIPRRGLSAHSLKCCVLVFNGRDLVVASASANPKPLLALAQPRLGKELPASNLNMDRILSKTL